MTTKLETLEASLRAVLGEQIQDLTLALGELTLRVKPEDYLSVMRALRDHADLRFEELIDLCGVDYSTYGEGAWDGARFAVVSHLLSMTHNWRLRVRVFAVDDELPVLASLIDVWPSANWYEREAFDFFGILFEGHNDLRRILTDYGFIGHPFRKRFPGVRLRRDALRPRAKKRVIYQPVTIEPREIVPRVIREEHYGIK
ncbi:NADH-quinone oxidoreductase subunit C [Undibacterium arcticum]